MSTYYSICVWLKGLTDRWEKLLADSLIVTEVPLTKISYKLLMGQMAWVCYDVYEQFGAISQTNKVRNWKTAFNLLSVS